MPLRELSLAFFQKLGVLLRRKPTVSFVIVLVLLFSVIALAHYLRLPESQSQEKSPEPKVTRLFIPTTDRARLSVPAQVRKDSTQTIVALAPGTVTALSVQPGKHVGAGTTLLSLSNDYGSQTSDFQKRIAENENRLTEETYGLDKKILSLQSEIAKHDDALTKKEEELAFKRLKDEKQALEIQRENSRLALGLANASDALLRPKTFVSGRIERVLVRKGDTVTAGTPLVTLRADRGTITLEALVSKETSSLFDSTVETMLSIDGEETFGLLPTAFSEEETTNGLYSILFTLSPGLQKNVTDGEYLTLALPLRAKEDGAVLIPLDAIFQDDTRAWVFIEENGLAKSQEVRLGQIFGSFALVQNGLPKDAKVVLSRSVISGDTLVPVR